MDARRCALLVLLAATLAAQAGVTNLLTNSDFETVNAGSEPKLTFPGWTEYDSGPTTYETNAVHVAATALSGSYSALMGKTSTLGGGGHMGQMLATALTTPFTFTCKFALEDPGSGTARSFKLYLNQDFSTVTANNKQINVQIVDNGNSGIGDVQVYDGSWRTILTDVVTFSSNLDAAPQVNTLTVAGVFSPEGSSYTVTVNGSATAALSYFQNGMPTQLNWVIFNTTQTDGKRFVVDGARLEIPVADNKGTVVLLR